jgi:predicted amidohydrolase YtcJ
VPAVVADLVLTGGSVLTVDPTRPRAEAVAIEAGRIAAVGSRADVRELIGSRTEVVELGGRTLLPGFQDAHLHVASGGLTSVQCDLYRAAAPRDHGTVIAAYAAANPEAEWIVGGGWSMDDYGAMPTREQLDAIVADKPVFLETRDGHTAWVNTRALELAHVGASTADPDGGVIDRDEAGNPTGTLQESAVRLVSKLLPPVTEREWGEALLRAQAELHALGITACQEAKIEERAFGAYVGLAARGDLTMRLEANLLWSDERGDEQLEELLEQRARGTVGRLRVRGVKLFQDGVAENFTAAMLEPYLDGRGGVTANAGLSMFPPERLERDVTLLDAHGFQVHVHAIGDRAVRESLDALERARRANGSRDARHHLAHLQFVHAADLPRFAELGVVANVTPLWAVRSGYVEELTLPFLCAGVAATMYPFGSLLRAGAALAFGSDWSVSTADPLQQLDVAVNRREAGSLGEEPLLPEERLDLETAITAATRGSAYVNHLDRATGSIEVGKFADLVVLDRDLLDRGAGEIGDTGAVLTLVEGVAVHDMLRV